MSDSVITIKVEDELKAEASAVAKELGIPLATYLKMCLKQLSREKKVHFERLEVPRQVVVQRWRKQEEDLKSGKNIVKTSSLSELRASLDS